MAVVQLAVISGLQNADTNASALNSVVLRDNQGNIQGATITGSTLQTTGNYQGTVVAKTASFTAGSATHYLCSCSSSAVTVTLPAASTGQLVYTFVKTDSVTANALTFSGVSGIGSITAQWGKVTIFSDGVSTWFSV